MGRRSGDGSGGAPAGRGRAAARLPRAHLLGLDPGGGLGRTASAGAARTAGCPCGRGAVRSGGTAREVQARRLPRTHHLLSGRVGKPAKPLPHNPIRAVDLILAGAPHRPGSEVSTHTQPITPLTSSGRAHARAAPARRPRPRGAHLNVFVFRMRISASPMPPLRMVTVHHSGTLPRRQTYLASFGGAQHARCCAIRQSVYDVGVCLGARSDDKPRPARVQR